MRFKQMQALLDEAVCPRDVARGPGGENDSPGTRRRKAAFLRHFAETLSIAVSARLAGIKRSTHYVWLDTDMEYRAAFERSVRMEADVLTGMLFQRATKGVFKPYIYKGRPCQAARERTLCQLADGTSAFADELPEGAVVIGRRTVTVHDGEVLGRYKIDRCALRILAGAWLPGFTCPRRSQKEEDTQSSAPGGTRSDRKGAERGPSPDEVRRELLSRLGQRLASGESRETGIIPPQPGQLPGPKG